MEDYIGPVLAAIIILWIIGATIIHGRQRLKAEEKSGIILPKLNSKNDTRSYFDKIISRTSNAATFAKKYAAWFFWLGFSRTIYALYEGSSQNWVVIVTESILLGLGFAIIVYVGAYLTYIFFKDIIMLP